MLFISIFILRSLPLLNNNEIKNLKFHPKNQILY